MSAWFVRASISLGKIIDNLLVSRVQCLSSSCPPCWSGPC
uniref:Uncharacterized protein n=1 Tax=Arundo donax TaxID=35708 RepID=A0A0A9AML9_ARUDO